MCGPGALLIQEVSMALTFTATPSIIVFDNNSGPTEKATLAFQSFPNTEKAKFLFRLNGSAFWQIASGVQFKQLQGGAEDITTGKLDVSLAPGDVLECRAFVGFQFTDNLPGTPGISDTIVDSLKEIARVEVTTIRRFSQLPTLALDTFFVTLGATFVQLKETGPTFRTDIWLLDKPIKLDADGFFDPNLIEAALDIHGGKRLHTSSPSGIGTIEVSGRFPGIGYQAVVLLRDRNGSYSYSLDFANMNGGSKPGVYQRDLDCKLISLFTVDSGDPSGEGELVGVIDVALGKEPQPWTKNWRTSLIDEEIKMYNNQPVSPGNGNLASIQTFSNDLVKQSSHWPVVFTGTMIDKDGLAADDVVHVTSEDQGFLTEFVVVETKIGPDETDDVSEFLDFVGNTFNSNNSGSLHLTAKIVVTPKYTLV
jgi:hypothetical protein